MTGKPRTTNWFQTPVTATASVTAPGRSPSPQHPEGHRHPHRGPAGRDYGERGRRLGDDERLAEAQPGQRRLPGRREGREVEHGRAAEQRDVLPREPLDDVPDRGVVAILGRKNAKTTAITAIASPVPPRRHQRERCFFSVGAVLVYTEIIFSFLPMRASGVTIRLPPAGTT